MIYIICTLLMLFFAYLGLWSIVLLIASFTFGMIVKDN